jgi:hypothetical protein
MIDLCTSASVSCQALRECVREGEGGGAESIDAMRGLPAQSSFSERVPSSKLLMGSQQTAVCLVSQACTGLDEHPAIHPAVIETTSQPAMAAGSCSWSWTVLEPRRICKDNVRASAAACKPSTYCCSILLLQEDVGCCLCTSCGGHQLNWRKL